MKPREAAEPTQPSTWSDESIIDGVPPVSVGGAEGSALGAAAVAQARTQLGVEDDGNNCGVPHERYVHWIAGPSAPCLPWSAYFVGWAFDTSTLGNRDHHAPWGTSGYVPWIYDWAHRTGRLITEPSHGDVFFLNPTSQSDSHMGLVAGADPSRTIIYTCEGNWSNRVLGQTRDYRRADIRFARI